MQSSAFRDAEVVFLRNQHNEAIAALTGLNAELCKLRQEKTEMNCQIDQVLLYTCAFYIFTQIQNQNSVQEKQLLAEKQSHDALLNRLRLTEEHIQKEKLLAEEWDLKTPDVEKLEAEIVHLQADVSTKEQALAVHEKSKRQFEQKLSVIDGEIEMLKSLLDTKQKELDGVALVQDSETAHMESDKAALETELHRVKQVYIDLDVKKKELESSLRQFERDRRHIEKETNLLLSEIEQLNKEETAHLKSKEEFEMQQNTIRLQIVKNTEKNTKLLESVRTMDSEIISQTKLEIDANRELDLTRTAVAELDKKLVSVITGKSLLLTEMAKNKNLVQTLQIEKKEFLAECETAKNSILFLSKKQKKLAKQESASIEKLRVAKDQHDALANRIVLVEKELNAKLDQYKTVSVENEFLRQKIFSKSDSIFVGKRTHFELVEKIQDLRNRISVAASEAKTVESERNQAEVEIAGIQADLDFLAANDLLCDGGRIKPVVLEPSFIELNKYLVSAQSEEDLEKTILLLIQKISDLLELLDANEKLQVRLSSQLVQSEEIASSLRQEQARLIQEASETAAIRKERSLQMGLNQARSGHHVSLTPELLSEFIECLTNEEKLNITSFEYSWDPRILQEFVNLNQLEISNFADKQTLISFLTNQIEGVTSVVNLGNTIIAYSGQRVRLTVKLLAN